MPLKNFMELILATIISGAVFYILMRLIHKK